MNFARKGLIVCLRIPYNVVILINMWNTYINKRLLILARLVEKFLLKYL